MSDSEAPYLVDLHAGVWTLTFNRPEAGNAIPSEAVPGLISRLREIAGDPAIRCVLMRGEGKNFSAGGDVKGFGRSLDDSREKRAQDFSKRLDIVAELVTIYDAIEVPVIAACRGAVAGGGLMYTLGADIILADRTVAFMFAHQRFGLSPDAGVSYSLPRVVGLQKAKELILTGAMVGAEEALRIGLVNRLVDAGQLDAEAAGLATLIAQGPQHATRAAKRLLKTAGTEPLAAHLLRERDCVAACVADPDFEEGVRAFLEKRAAVFPSAQ